MSLRQFWRRTADSLLLYQEVQFWRPVRESNCVNRKTGIFTGCSCVLSSKALPPKARSVEVAQVSPDSDLDAQTLVPNPRTTHRDLDLAFKQAQQVVRMHLFF